MSTQPPLVSATGIWYAYFPAQTQAGDNQSHVLNLSSPESFGNVSLFAEALSGVSLTHRAVVNVDCHASCEHEVAIERTLGVQIDKDPMGYIEAGAILERGQSIFVAGSGNAAYQGILDEGQIIRTFVQAPGDQIAVKDGYISVMAQPV